MRVSTSITPDDHQEFQRALIGGRMRLALRLKSIQMIAVFVFLLSGLAAFAIALAQATHDGGLALFLDQPYLILLVVLGLLCVPTAAAVLWGIPSILRIFGSVSAGRIDAASLREGVNLGRARFTIGDECLRVDMDLLQESYPWRVFDSLRETDNLLCLMLGNHRGIMVPKRMFDGEPALGAFRALFAARVGAAT